MNEWMNEWMNVNACMTEQLFNPWVPWSKIFWMFLDDFSQLAESSTQVSSTGWFRRRMRKHAGDGRRTDDDIPIPHPTAWADVLNALLRLSMFVTIKVLFHSHSTYDAWFVCFLMCFAQILCDIMLFIICSCNRPQKMIYDVRPVLNSVTIGDANWKPRNGSGKSRRF